MTKEEIKKTQNSLLIPLIIGVVLIVTGIAVREWGATRSGAKVGGIYITLLGFVVSFTAGKKLLAFRSYLKKNRNNNQTESSK